ncbi:ArsR family transcriptional regulator [Kitasatospora sp. NPDC094019]|uniref:ArsR family transcriptional regulator n=1 Tax=Kitasatospora sp. NPDC094019 TaxID=3364091 RepID=UPI00381418ED
MTAVPQTAPASAGAVFLSELMFPSTPRCLALAAEFKLAELLADGPLPVAELAERAGVTAGPLAKVLSLLTEDGVFEEVEPGVFANTGLSELLRPGVPGSMDAMARMVGAEWLWASWGALDHSLATGKPGFEKVHGTALWPWLQKNPSAAATFNQAMTDFTDALSDALVSAYPEFAEAGAVCDLGGGQGTYLAAILHKYDALARGVLADLPSVIEQARTQPDVAKLAEQGRLDFEPVDFFAGVPAGIGAYVTKQVWHSWPDEALVRLLRKCREASPGARFVAAELVHREGVPRFVKNFDLVMLVTMSGEVRTEEQFAEVFRRGGFRLNRVVSTGTAFALLEAVPDPDPLD